MIKLTLKTYLVHTSFRKSIGTWSAGTPGIMKFKSGMETELSRFNAKTVYRFVTVIQPPFMMKNLSAEDPDSK